MLTKVGKEREMENEKVQKCDVKIKVRFYLCLCLVMVIDWDKFSSLFIHWSVSNTVLDSVAGDIDICWW